MVVGATALFLIDTAVKSCQKSSGFNIEGVANSEESSESDRPAGFDLLPVARRKTQRNHVFLSVSLAFPEAFYPDP